MTEPTDVQQRLDAIDENLKDLRTAVQALLHAQLRPSSGKKADDAASAWIAGEVRDMAAQSSGEADVSGYMQSAPVHDSKAWCYSRYVCLTMECGGSSWC